MTSGQEKSMRDALEAVLLFYTVGEWTDEKRLRWAELTGKCETTTKILCDTVRAALGVRA